MRIRSPGWEDPLEEEMTIHSSILALNNPMDRAAWWAAFQSRKELDMTEHAHTILAHTISKVSTHRFYKPREF